jgi:hypothetical protein
MSINLVCHVVNEQWTGGEIDRSIGDVDTCKLHA